MQCVWCIWTYTLIDMLCLQTTAAARLHFGNLGYFSTYQQHTAYTVAFFPIKWVTRLPFRFLQHFKECTIRPYCDERVSVCIREYILETTRTKFTKFSVHEACAHGLPVFIRWHSNVLCTSGFVNDVICSLQNARLRVSWKLTCSSSNLCHRPAQLWLFL